MDTNQPHLVALKEHEENRARHFRRLRRFMRHLPRRTNVSRYPGLKRFSGRIKGLPYLWVYKGPPLVRALYLGSVITLLPLFGAQIVTGLGAALLFRANLPVIIALAFVSNPLTAAPIFFATYKTGKAILGITGASGWGTAASLVPALSLGGIVCGVAMGAGLHLAFARLQAAAAKRNSKIKAMRQLVKPPTPAAESSG